MIEVIVTLGIIGIAIYSGMKIEKFLNRFEFWKRIKARPYEEAKAELNIEEEWQ